MSTNVAVRGKKSISFLVRNSYCSVTLVGHSCRQQKLSVGLSSSMTKPVGDASDADGTLLLGDVDEADAKAHDPLRPTAVAVPLCDQDTLNKGSN